MFLDRSEIYSIKNNYYVIVKTGQADSSGSYFKICEIKQCCHFFITKCKIFKLLIKPLFLKLFEPDQSEIKEIFYEIVNLHSVGNFSERNTGYIYKIKPLQSSLSETEVHSYYPSKIG